MSEYNKMANDFLKSTKTRMKVSYEGVSFPDWDDNEAHDIYKVTFYRDGRQATFRFYDSINNTKANSTTDAEEREEQFEAYDILACLTKYDTGTFDEFCREFGYNNDSISAIRTYNNCKKEYRKVYKLWHDVMEQLQEIY